MGESLTAFELLLDIDRRCRLLAADLPLQETRRQTWSGIGFRLGEHCFVAPMGEVAEVLTAPRLSRIPGVKPWVAGVTNLRGQLLPVTDLGGFLGLEATLTRKQRRVLVVDHDELFTGLLVDEVLGLQHFALDGLELSPPSPLLGSAAPYIQGHFQREHCWGIFSPFALAQAPGFVDVAL